MVRKVQLPPNVEMLMEQYRRKKGGCSPCVRNLRTKVEQAFMNGMSKHQLEAMIQRNIQR